MTSTFHAAIKHSNRDSTSPFTHDAAGAVIELRDQFKEEQKDATDARTSKRSRATFADVTVLPFREVMRRARHAHASGLAQGEGEHYKRHETVEAAPEIKGEASEVEATIKAEPKEEPLSAEELAATLEKYRNPHAKIKKDSQFDGAMVTDRLKAIGFERYPIDIEERLQRFLFNRHYIHNLYGGSFVDTFPSPSDEKVAIHGLNDFMFITLDLHPHAPLNPGDPGLFLNMVPADGTWGNARQVVRVFVRLRDTPKALWQYSGNYRMYPSDPSLEKSSQDNHRWEPTLEEIEELVSDARSREIASSLSWQEISAAYERNEEVIILHSVEREIGVWCMKCVGYDVEFQRLLVDNADRFTPPAGKRKRHMVPPMWEKGEQKV
ncbi:hypothetical protein POSPLADRAFT_1066785 [Postia placenta MAD-698-R-SB12]|uniref:DUF6697 domain-containing protein n=1 Tax=Postia placenta MAD-698-R-SB12 TaxID=670580 RepID=A0A1X6MW41_9APHY|nr:hypothetical protein POSPLADRAFT_1066785 [Postia placenta MAD-698-R-SB12]OSX60588.1 hypothetical protein POSPLADRAFT_1066785 [Postia placenta MAD-698-R-SB12]